MQLLTVMIGRKGSPFLLLDVFGSLFRSLLFAATSMTESAAVVVLKDPYHSIHPNSHDIQRTTTRPWFFCSNPFCFVGPTLRLVLSW